EWEGLDCQRFVWVNHLGQYGGMTHDGDRDGAARIKGSRQWQVLITDGKISGSVLYSSQFEKADEAIYGQLLLNS
ncbi:hypothetical protein, partial [Klebsiella pneumoniae]|uniref:hypothetical protein n=1 Tax=Klebsiella pneumoniae TaxID=573 RepID=UPI0013D13A59